MSEREYEEVVDRIMAGSAPEPRPLGWVVVGEGPRAPRGVVQHHRDGDRGGLFLDEQRARDFRDFIADEFPDNRYTVEPVGAPPREPGEAVERRFFDLAAAHARPVRDHIRERVPEGTRYVGTAWVTPGGELVITDGCPSDEMEPEHPLAHHCDEMGCSTVSHVIARALPPSSPQSEPREQDRRKRVGGPIDRACEDCYEHGPGCAAHASRRYSQSEDA